MTYLNQTRNVFVVVVSIDKVSNSIRLNTGLAFSIDFVLCDELSVVNRNNKQGYMF